MSMWILEVKDLLPPKIHVHVDVDLRRSKLSGGVNTFELVRTVLLLLLFFSSYGAKQWVFSQVSIGIGHRINECVRKLTRYLLKKMCFFVTESTAYGLISYISAVLHFYLLVLGP